MSEFQMWNSDEVRPLVYPGEETPSDSFKQSFFYFTYERSGLKSLLLTFQAISL